MKNRVAALFVAVVATGCVTEPPAGSGSGPGSAPAVAVPATRIIEPEAEVVAVPTPLPLPGQLKPVASAPAGDAAPEGAGPDPAQRVRAANAVARLEPAADGYVNAIQVFPWTEGALYQVYTAPGQVTDLALAPGEQLVSLSAGDTVRWKVAETASGSGANVRPHVLVKPTASKLVTNLVIATDRRVYHVELRSLDATYMASVSWTYPEEELAFRTAAVQSRAPGRAAAADGIRPEALHFGYRILGDQPPWRPVRAFDDGRRVFIQFPPGTAEAPPLFLIGPEGEVALVNYRVRGSYYVVDRLFDVAELRLGTDPQTVVRIERRS